MSESQLATLFDHTKVLRVLTRLHNVDMANDSINMCSDIIVKRK